MANHGIFEIDGADPFAAGLHEILGAVDDFNEAFIVHGGDVASFEPTVFGPAVRLVGRIVVPGSDPRAAYLELAGSFSIARSFDVFAFLAVGPRAGRPVESRSPPSPPPNFLLLSYAP